MLAAAIAVVAALVARYPRPRAMFLLVTWAAVVSALRYLLPPSRVGPEVVMLTVFVVLALIVSLMLGVASERRPVIG